MRTFVHVLAAAAAAVAWARATASAPLLEASSTEELGGGYYYDDNTPPTSDDEPNIPYMPGVCMPHDGVYGVGCGVLGTAVEADAPLQSSMVREPIFDMQPCPTGCYSDKAPDSCPSWCTFGIPLANGTHAVYKGVPMVGAEFWQEQDACYTNSTSTDWEAYANTSAIVVSHHHGGFFHSSSSSTVTYNFMFRYFKETQSMASITQSYVWYRLGLQALSANTKLSPLFLLQMAEVMSKAPTFDHSNPTNRAIWYDTIQTYGSYVVVNALMGAKLVSRVYFDSCWLSTQSGQWVTHQSSSSSFVFFHHNHVHVDGYNNTDSNFYSHSDVELQLYGGNENGLNIYNASNPLPDSTMNDWLNSVPKTGLYSPIEYRMMSIGDVLTAVGKGDWGAQYNAAVIAYNEDNTATLAKKASSYGPRKTDTPSWCKPTADVNNVGLRGAEAMAKLSAAAPPLPACPPLV